MNIAAQFGWVMAGAVAKHTASTRTCEDVSGGGAYVKGGEGGRCARKRRGTEDTLRRINLTYYLLPTTYYPNSY